MSPFTKQIGPHPAESCEPLRSVGVADKYVVRKAGNVWHREALQRWNSTIRSSSSSKQPTVSRLENLIGPQRMHQIIYNAARVVCDPVHFNFNGHFLLRCAKKGRGVHECKRCCGIN